MSRNKLLLAIASVTFAAITFTNVASSQADSAFVAGNGGVFRSAGNVSTVSNLAVGAVGTGPFVVSGSNTNSVGNVTNFAVAGTATIAPASGFGTATVNPSGNPNAFSNVFISPSSPPSNSTTNTIQGDPGLAGFGYQAISP